MVTYNTSVTKNTGVLASDKQWFNKLSHLIDNPNYRVFIGKNAREYVIKNFSSDAIIPKWENALNHILS
jgi:glycosyltransferase involved in cell wall biosynthesis